MDITSFHAQTMKSVSYTHLNHMEGPFNALFSTVTARIAAAAPPIMLSLIHIYNFRIEYYIPYFYGHGITSREQTEVQKHAEKESYAGICDEVRLGVSLIFYLQNVAEYLNEEHFPRIVGRSVTLSALSISGKIILPMMKNEKQKKTIQKNMQNRNHLIAAARDGDEDAIENLTLADMDTYSMLSRRIAYEDVLSIVDTCFMPYGVESDQYSVIRCV